MKKHKLLSIAISSVLAIGSITAYLPAMYEAPAAIMTANAEDYEYVTEGVLSYYVYGDHAEVSLCDDDAKGEVIIPDKINGVPVTKIQEFSFQALMFHERSITSVVIPDSVTYIGSYAFIGCHKLNSIWTCQEMCSQKIPKILDKQESGGVMSQLG